MTRPLQILLATALLAGCGSDSSSDPTGPQAAPPAANVVFNASSALDPHRARIETIVQDTVRRAAGAVSVGTLTVTVTDDASRAIFGWGIGGFANGPNDIEVAIDAGFANLTAVLDERLPGTLAHEIHHAVRWRGPGPPVTLLEGLVFEGLADRFALDVVGGPAPPWIDAFPPSERGRWQSVAEPNLDDGFTYAEWFFGQGPRDLPRWMGYTLGYLLVGDLLSSRSTSAAALVNEPAASFDPR